jgi:hypothetical protein
MLTTEELAQFKVLQDKHSESEKSNIPLKTSDPINGNSAILGTTSINSDQKDINTILKEMNINVSESEIDLMKKNPNLFEVVRHQVEQKRSANKEAQKYRSDIEKIQKEKNEKETEEAKKRGEFEKLYNEEKSRREEVETRQKQILIEHELKIAAIRHGIQKPEYLKLFDQTKIKIDSEGNPKNLDELIENFKKENPSLFVALNGNPTITPDSRRAGGPEGLNQMTLEELRLKASKSQDRKDLAAYMAAMRSKKT